MDLVQDLRYAVRTFVRSPSLALAAVVTLALGIGANSAVFSVVYSTLLRPLPFPDADALVFVYESEPASPNAAVPFAKYEFLKEGTRTLSGLAALSPAAVTFGDGEPEQVFATRMSPNLPAVLGVTPVMGRWFTAEEDRTGAAPVIVLGHGVWSRRFGRDATILGRTITVEGKPHVVLGIMPREFEVLSLAEVWLPLTSGGITEVRLIGRLRDRETLEQAREDLTLLNQGYNERAGTTRDLVVRPLLEVAAADDRAALLLLQGTVLFVLFVACANVANLLLARSVTRRREVAVRAALGAGRARIARQILTESVLLSVFGGLLGLALAAGLVELFVWLAPPTFIRRGFISMDAPVLAFTAAVAVLTGLTFGMAPALRSWWRSPSADLQGGGATRGSSGVRTGSRALVVLEVALAVVLVVGAALLTKSLLRMEAVPAGFRAAGVITFELALPSARYSPERARIFYQELLADIERLPTVASAGAISDLPLAAFAPGGEPVRLETRSDRGRERPLVQFRTVTPGYFETLDIPVLCGATAESWPAAGGRPVVIVNEQAAKRLWPGQDPIGRRLQLASDASAPWRDVIAVVGDVRSAGLDEPAPMQAFVLHSQSPERHLAIAIRTLAGDPEAVLPDVTRRVRAMDAVLPLIRTRPMRAVVAASLGDARLSAAMIALFAVITVVVAVLGIYSVMAWSVAQRTREIAIRMAIGADPAAVQRLVVGEGGVLAAAGVAAGLCAALVLAPVLATMLYGVGPMDAPTFAGTAAAVLAVALAACYVPARRAMRVEPLAALHQD